MVGACDTMGSMLEFPQSLLGMKFAFLSEVLTVHDAGK